MLSTPRLRGVNRQEKNHRKFVCVMNDVAKTQLDRYEGYIEKEKQEAAQRNQTSIVYTRRNVVRQRVLKICMKCTREEVERKYATDIYGRYHGVPVEQISGEIDTYIERNHPRVRRKQKIGDLLHEGYENGAILDKKTIQNKVKEYFERPLFNFVRVFRKKKKDTNNEQGSEQNRSFLPPIGNGPYTGSIEHEKQAPNPEQIAAENETHDHRDRQFVNKKVNKFLAGEVPDNTSVHSEVQNSAKYPAEMDIRPITLQAEQFHGVGIGHHEMDYNKDTRTNNRRVKEVHEKSKTNRTFGGETGDLTDNTRKKDSVNSNRIEEEKQNRRLPPLNLNTSTVLHTM